MDLAEFAVCFEDPETGEPVLNEASRRHLFEAAEMLVDQIGEDVRLLDAMLLRDPSAAVWNNLNWLHHYLPPMYAASYDYGFIRAFSVTVLTVIYKLGGPWTGLSSVAEELAMHAVMESAESQLALLKDEGVDVNEIEFSVLWDMAFWDLDYQALFDPELDGIQDSEVGRQSGMANLDRSEWFVKFTGADTPPHPMTWRRASPTPGERNR
jgi:hypothetical protein